MNINSKETSNNIKNLLMEGSYIIYEFKDKEIKIEDDKGTLSIDSLNNIYTKKVSPLFVPDVINEENNQEFLDILTNEIPYYFLEPSLPRSDSDKDFLSITRDCGINDVPDPMQNSFWAVWFRDSQGEIQNSILLDVYNKLRFPFINENQYMNADLFPELAKKAFTSTSDDNSLIEFKYTTEDNNEDISNGERGCVDYLEDIINQKLVSVYTILDYNPDQFALLSDWGESLYQSGVLDISEVEREKTIFKLQDLRYELIRRKFAGSSTLYNLSLSSIDRQGSFIGVIPAGRLNSTFSVFRDKRYIRIVDIPGILSQFASLTENKPLLSFYERPYIDNENYIPLSTCIPLFYTSADRQGSAGEYSYNPEYFLLYNNSPVNLGNFYWNNEQISGYNYQNKFLRDNNLVLEWDQLQGILSEDSVNTFFPRLDEKPGGEYRTLDGNYTDAYGEESPMRLDIETPYFSMASVVGNFLDITANHHLYHKNTIQENLGDLYPYMTYPIASNNGVSLMDIPWIDYLENCTDRKSRVQDQAFFGVQINKYEHFSDPQLAEYTFFALSYSSEEVSTFDTENYSDFYSYEEFKNKFNEEPKFAYIWYFTVNYDILTHNVTRLDYILFSKVTLNISEKRYGGINVEALKDQFSDADSFNELLSTNMGVLPFTYGHLKNSKLLGYKLGFGYDENNELQFYDTLDDLGYAKAYYLFSDSDMVIGDSYFRNLSNDDSVGMSPYNPNSVFTKDPSQKTQSVFFGIKRIIDGVDNYYWSEMIRVLPVDSTFIRNLLNSEMSMDWYSLNYELNPYMNFTLKSSSTLRHKEVIPSKLALDKNLNEDLLKTYLIGPSEYAGLSSLSRSRGYDFTCNDSGKTEVEGNDPHGFFLERIKADTEKFTIQNREWARIYGDNRTSDAFDDKTDNVSSSRSDIYKDENNIPCIRIERGNYYTEAFSGAEEIAYNQLRLSPCDLSLLDNYDDVYNNWYWNEPNTGISIFCNFKMSDPNIIGNATIKNGKIESINNVESDKIIIQRRGYSEDKVDSEFSLKFTHTLIDNRLESKIRFEYYPNGNSNYPLFVESDPYISNIEESLWTVLSIKDNLIEYEGELEGLKTFIEQNKRIGVTVRCSLEGGDDTNNNLVSLALIVDNRLYTKEYKVNNTEATSDTDSIQFKDLGFKYREENTYNSDIYGYPPKYYPGSNLGSIEIGSTIKDNIQSNIFCGYIYDLRLYNTGLSNQALTFMNQGIMRELFSYAPSTYKMVYSVYKDFGIFKPVKGIPITAGNIAEIGTVRIFDREIWDSILVDMYPISPDEMADNKPQYDPSFRDPLEDRDIYDEEGNLICIEQNLTDNSEITNNRRTANSLGNLGDVTVIYNGNEYKIKGEDWSTVITTSLYPVDYKNHLFASEVNLSSTKKSDGNLSLSSNTGDESSNVRGISLPVIQTGNTLRYNAELSLNFEIPPISDLSIYYSRGSNIELIYNNLLNKPVVRQVNNTIRNSTSNHILIPLTIPEQTQLKANNIGYLDRFYLKDILINSSLLTFLKASSYYKEVRIPIAVQPELGQSPHYVYKWDAIRGLREGSYFITVKYPLQILPFMDYEFNNLSKEKFAPLYGSSRFKIEVKGRPIAYKNNNYKLNGYPDIYLSQNISNTLVSGKSIHNPEDNRTFPHRIIDIDLYVMDSDSSNVGLVQGGVEQYTFKWRKIASNWGNSDDIILLNREKLGQALSLTTPIPLFLSKNYTSPFFISKYDKGTGKYDSSQSDDDTIDPIVIYPVYNEINKEAETLTINREEDLDNLRLVAGKSYKILFDYDAQVTELSFIDKTFDGTIENEKKYYSRMVNLLDTDNPPSDYMYNGACTWYGKNNIYISSTTSGFDTNDNDNDALGWADIDVGNSDKNYFGNPYSRAHEKNYLLQISPDNRNEIDKLAYFPYIIKEEEEDDYNRIFPCKYLTNLDVVTNRQSPTVYTTTNITINENQILAQLWSKVKGEITTSINGLITNSSGLFTNLSIIYPNINYIKDSTGDDLQINYSSIINSRDYDLFAYTASDRNISSRNDNITIVRRGVYTNNLIKNKNFLSATYWDISTGGKYVSDLGWDNGVGKDVFNMIYEDTPITMRYLAGTQVISASYEVAFNIASRTDDYEDLVNWNELSLDHWGDSNLKVYAQFYKNNREVGDKIGLKDINKSQREGEVMPLEILPDPDKLNWYTFSSELSDPVEADSVAYIIEATKECNIFVTKPVIRRSSSKSHRLGLADALYTMSTSDEASKVTTVSHKIVFFRNKNTLEPVPIQFKNTVGQRPTSNTNLSTTYYPKSGQSRVADFIRSCSLGKAAPNSRLEILFKPWNRRMYYWYQKKNSDGVILNNQVVFYGYRVNTDSLGVTSAVISKIPTTDIYGYPENGLTYDPINNEIVINEIILKTNGEELMGYNTNLKVLMSDPIEFLDERFSLLSNCFNPSRYQQRLNSPVAVTNIQLLSPPSEQNPQEIIYELEYLPIIYDESDQHLSLNILLHKS